MIDRRTLRRARHQLCQAWRSVLVAKGALEVATPILHAYPDIAPVRQFMTMHPTSSERFFLRIAPTEKLKALLADGEEQVFEFARNFRDDPRDCTHLPEFTSLEYMAVGATCEDMEELAVELCKAAVYALGSLSQAPAPAWARAVARGEVTRVPIVTQIHAWNSAASASSTEDEHALLDRMISAHAASTGGVVLMSGFPEWLGGPAASYADLPGFKQRTEMFVNGLEIANMSSTLTDAALLGAWHDAGLTLKRKLGIEPNERDIALFDAVQRGIPPSAVIGIGVERVLQAYFNLENIA